MRALFRVSHILVGAVLVAPAVLAAQTRVEKSRSVQSARVLTTAKRYLGTRYVFGGTTPRGFDCSGYVQFVFRKHGVRLPRTSRQQAAAGRRLTGGLSSLRVGDLLLFATKGRRIDHVAIYAGGNRIIHASASGGGVRYDNLNSKRGKWLTSHHVASRRVLYVAAPLVADPARSAETFDGPNPAKAVADP